MREYTLRAMPPVALGIDWMRASLEIDIVYIPEITFVGYPLAILRRLGLNDQTFGA
jgi:hypothetical protein